MYCLPSSFGRNYSCYLKRTVNLWIRKDTISKQYSGIGTQLFSRESLISNFKKPCSVHKNGTPYLLVTKYYVHHKTVSTLDWLFVDVQSCQQNFGSLFFFTSWKSWIYFLIFSAVFSTFYVRLHLIMLLRIHMHSL